MSDRQRKRCRDAARLLMQELREAREASDFAPPTFAAACDGDVVIVVAAGYRADELVDLVERQWCGHFQDASDEALANGTWRLP